MTGLGSLVRYFLNLDFCVGADVRSLRLLEIIAAVIRGVPFNYGKLFFCLS
ncbi:hypothetical protein Clim_1156 [Chlorobium limicola DSM 245]|uniref:Uncharacterized protein n=1 Tax=Chlorobium limicola (strain DSM 245 / NBRC 103803 / 6330) TaxID=290315 RepID=B3ECF0_CHLL2|nr:hypothetical protein Clim_1156 [Chlorobium limicola DSM 245]